MDLLALSAFHIAILLMAAILLVAAAVSDAVRYRIPNGICLALLLLFPAYVVTSPLGVHWEQNVMVTGLVLLSGFAMFLGNLAGAGDIKLLTVVALWAGPHLIAVLLIVTAISGGILAFGMAAMTYFRNRHNKEKLAVAKVPIPYGIAIALGGLNILYLLSQSALFPV